MPAAACQWCLENEKELYWCSKCKASSYCSRDCQVNHWNNGHKEACKTLRKKIAKATAGNEEIQSFVQVFKEWRDQFSEMLPIILTKKLGEKYCYTVQRPSKVVKIVLSYDASTRLFRVQDISVVDFSTMDLESLDPTVQQIHSSILQSFETHNQRHPSHPAGFAWVQCNGAVAVMPAILDKKLKQQVGKLASDNDEGILIQMMEALRV